MKLNSIEVTEIFKSSGFRVEKIYQDHIFLYLVKDYKNYTYTKEKWFEAMPDDVFKVIEKSFGWHMLVDAKINE